MLADGVFSGGGIKGLAFAGGLQAAAEAGYDEWGQLAGTSAGAIEWGRNGGFGEAEARVGSRDHPTSQ